MKPFLVNNSILLLSDLEQRCAESYFDVFDLEVFAVWMCVLVCSLHCVVCVCLCVTVEVPCLLRVLLFSVCCGVALVPQVLLEFRYYTIPFLVLRLHLPTPTFMGVVAELALYSSLNMATLWLFLYRPFRWPGEEDWQRFMW